MPSRFRGAIFDVDGVLVDSPHERAWRETLHDLMDTTWSDIVPSSAYAPDAFTSRVYQDLVSGKPRLDGARAVLHHFRVPDPGTRVTEYAERKQERVLALILAGEFAAFPDAVRFVEAVSRRGIRLAAASSSKNAGLLLERVRVEGSDRRLLDIFTEDLSGRDFAHGKPDPEIFLASAAALGLTPGECFVVEDAVSGIQAAKAGGMAALGVARTDDAEQLAAAGADLVVPTLDDVDVDRLGEGRLARRSGRPAPT
jgi:beta-phosphoglucomutase-like phosphatase (HAD superfamily)